MIEINLLVTVVSIQADEFVDCVHFLGYFLTASALLYAGYLGGKRSRPK